MADVFGEAARLIAAGVPPDRLVAALTPDLRKALAFHLLNGWEGLPVLPVTTAVDVLHGPGAPGRKHLLIAACGEAECMMCAVFVCPHGEPLHFHHDGCPACAMVGPNPGPRWTLSAPGGRPLEAEHLRAQLRHLEALVLELQRSIVSREERSVRPVHIDLKRDGLNDPRDPLAGQGYIG